MINPLIKTIIHGLKTAVNQYLFLTTHISRKRSHAQQPLSTASLWCWCLFTPLMLIHTNSSFAVGKPPNSSFDYTGSKWYCNAGFKRKENGCVRVYLPPNAELDHTGSDWRCKRGFQRNHDHCVRHTLPLNAVSTFTKNEWICRKGYYTAHDKCYRMAMPSNAVMNKKKDGWQCILGYVKRSGKCVKVHHGAGKVYPYDKPDWQCRRTHKKQGDRCVPKTDAQMRKEQQQMFANLHCGHNQNNFVVGYCGGEYVYGSVNTCSTKKSRASGAVVLQSGEQLSISGYWSRKDASLRAKDASGIGCRLEVH